jgi:hypothetical protein
MTAFLKSGCQIHVAPVAADGADAYEIRCVPTVNGAPGTPVTQLVTKTRPAAASHRERPIPFRSVPSPMRPASPTGAIQLPVSVPSDLAG